MSLDLAFDLKQMNNTFFIQKKQGVKKNDRQKTNKKNKKQTNKQKKETNHANPKTLKNENIIQSEKFSRWFISVKSQISVLSYFFNTRLLFFCSQMLGNIT